MAHGGAGAGSFLCRLAAALPQDGRGPYLEGAGAIARWLDGLARRQGEGVNWYRREPDQTGQQQVQWCHGAPGIALSRLRAVEYGRSVAIAATSGISAVVAPDGSVVRSSGLFEPAVFVEEIAQRNSTTVAQRLGAVPEWALTAVGAAAVLVAARPALLRRPGRNGR